MSTRPNENLIKSQANPISYRWKVVTSTQSDPRQAWTRSCNPLAGAVLLQVNSPRVGGFWWEMAAVYFWEIVSIMIGNNNPLNYLRSRVPRPPGFRGPESRVLPGAL